MLNWVNLPNPKIPLVFHGVVGDDQREAKSPSYFNPEECAMVKYLFWGKRFRFHKKNTFFEIINFGPSINDTSHSLRFWTPPSPLYLRTVPLTKFIFEKENIFLGCKLRSRFT